MASLGVGNPNYEAEGTRLRSPPLSGTTVKRWRDGRLVVRARACACVAQRNTWLREARG